MSLVARHRFVCRLCGASSELEGMVRHLDSVHEVSLDEETIVGPAVQPIDVEPEDPTVAPTRDHLAPPSRPSGLTVGV